MNNDAFELAVEQLESVFHRAELRRIALEESSPGLARTRMEHRVAREPSLRSAIDTACRQWAAGEPWPLSDAETSVFLWDRVVEARTFARWLVERHARVDGDSPQSVLTWLLVDYWVLAGFYRWYARLWAMKPGDHIPQ